MRVLEVERRTKGSITYLGASMLLNDREWKPHEIADMYFERWPRQEANFRAVSQAVGFKDVHGYGKQLVDNVSVVTELDKLQQRTVRLEERADKVAGKLVEQTEALVEAEEALRSRQQRQKMVSEQLQQRVAQGKQITSKLQQLAEEQRQLVEEIPAQMAETDKLQEKVRKSAVQANKIKATFEKYAQLWELLQSRRRIFKHDVELDSLFSVMKVGLVLLVTYVLKEYLGDARMEPATFIDRVATLPARLRTTPELEILTFEYNRRDPDVMAVLAEQCEAINARRLPLRSGRVLRVHVDPPPLPRRPPPTNRRVKPGDRFRKT